MREIINKIRNNISNYDTVSKELPTLTNMSIVPYKSRAHRFSHFTHYDLLLHLDNLIHEEYDRFKIFSDIHGGVGWGCGLKPPVMERIGGRWLSEQRYGFYFLNAELNKLFSRIAECLILLSYSTDKVYGDNNSSSFDIKLKHGDIENLKNLFILIDELESKWCEFTE